MQGPITFDIHTPLDDAALRDHVKRALALDLPELGYAPHRPGCVRIIANGPSARNAPLEGQTLALNGSLRLFTNKGQAPVWWAACDPQELVADFLDVMPAATHYLVASKCHPKVFETLMKRGRQITVWHLDDQATWDLVEHRDPIRIAPSVTLTSFELMERLGWRAFETWGWDGCYLDGLHHAVPQDHIQGGIQIEVGHKTFDTTATWALEAENAVTRLGDYPHPLEINGGGMIGAVLEQHWAEGIREMLRNFAPAA